jgi:hypothetical protein
MAPADERTQHTRVLKLSVRRLTDECGQLSSTLPEGHNLAFVTQQDRPSAC